MLSSFFKALGQMGDPRLRRVVWLGVGSSLVLLTGVTLGFVWLVNLWVGEEVRLPLIGPVTWVNDLLSLSVVGLVLLGSVFLMIPIASAISSVFLDSVAAAVEAKHYPHLPPARPVPPIDAVRDTIGFLGVLVAGNLCAVILYVMIPPATPLIFLALNGFLLGREYFTLAAIRRVGRQEAAALRKRHAGRIWLAGTLMAAPLTIPVLNLVMPVLGAATFTHIFHDLEGPATDRSQAAKR